MQGAFARMVSSDCCAYVIAPVMQEETLSLLEHTNNGVPYVFIDSSLPGAAPLSTVAQDPFRGGRLAGKMMDLVSHTAGPFAVLRPYEEAFNLNERVRGFVSWFSGRPSVSVIDIVCPEINIEETHAILDDLILQTPDLRGIFAVAALVHKIADHIDAKGLKDRISVIGYDLVDENVTALREGKIDCLISQRRKSRGGMPCSSCTDIWCWKRRRRRTSICRSTSTSRRICCN